MGNLLAGIFIGFIVCILIMSKVIADARERIQRYKQDINDLREVVMNLKEYNKD